MVFLEAIFIFNRRNCRFFNCSARYFFDLWYFVLFNALLSLVLFGLTFIVPEVAYLSMLVGLVLLIPGLAVVVRRFHDIGKSGWNYAWVLLAVIPIAGLVVAILFLIWFCRDSQPGENKWGANPKE